MWFALMIVWLVHSTKLQRVSQYLSVFFLNRAKEFKNSFRSTYKEIQLVNLETSEKKLINRVVSDYIIDSILNTRMYIQRIKKEANL